MCQHFSCSILPYLYRGRGVCSRRLLTVITFLILEQTLPNLVPFSKNYLETIWYDMSLSTWLEVSMATIFWQACFFKISMSLLFKIKQKLSCSIFKSWDHFMVFLFVLITFDRFWTVFWSFGQIQISKMAGQDGRHSQMIRHLMMWASKETFSDVLSTLQVSLS